MKDVINITWEPKCGSLYRVVNKTGHIINSVPKAIYYYDFLKIKNNTNNKHVNKKFFLNENDVFMFLGKKERIPHYFSFYKILYKDIICWLIMSERLYEEKHKIIDPIIIL